MTLQPLEALLSDAASAMQAGWWQEAQALLEQACRIDPRRPDVLINLGLAHLKLDAPAKAVGILKRAVAARPDIPQAHLNLGLALSAIGRHKEAVASVARAVRLAPGDARTRHDQGTVCFAAGDAEAAIDAFRAATRLAPAFTEAWFNLGNLLKAAGQVEAAEQAWRAALAGEPQHVPSVLNLGALLFGSQQTAEALDCFDRAVAADSGSAVAHNGRGNALHALGRLDEALDAYAQAARLQPDEAEIRYNLGNQQFQLGWIDRAIDSFRCVLRLDAAHVQAAQNLLMALNYADRVDAAEVTEAHRCFATVVAPMRKPGGLLHPHDSASRLRVGFVSADLRMHSVAWFLLPLMQALDRSRIEVTCYSNVARPDAITERLQAASDRWRDIHELSDADAAAQVRADEIDVLVDLSGHTAGQRLGVFAGRAAPVQATWLGYPSTTGHPAIDLRIVDSITDPHGDAVDALATERLVRLPRCFVCYRPPEAIEPARAVPVARDIDADLVLGSFNNLAKVSDTTIELWAAVLDAVPRSSLVLKAAAMEQPGVQSRLVAALGSHGIAPARIRFLPHEATLAGHLARYAGVDVALDTFPYQGTTTTCEALAMGLPVISLTGDRHASRVGASLLAAAGQPQWAATSPAGFIACAASVAAELRAGHWPRAMLQQQFDQSALCDADGFAAAFAGAIWALC